MTPALAFAQEFAYVVHLVLHEAPAADQDTALRSAVVALRLGETEITTRGFDLLAEGAEVPTSFVGVSDLLAQLRGHGIVALRFDATAAATAVMMVARQLATPPDPSGPPTAAWSVLADDTSGINATVDTALPLADAARPSGGHEATPDSQTGADHSGANLPFAAVRRSSATPAELFARIDAAPQAPGAGQLVEQLFFLAEDAAGQGRVDELLDVLDGAVTRQHHATDVGLQRVFKLLMRRLGRPFALRPIVDQISGQTDHAARAIDVCRRVGDAAVDMLVETLVAAESRSARRAVFDALLRLRLSAETLQHLMRDPRWFVVRNAVDLAAEHRLTELEPQCIALVRHSDERVRRSALHALARLGTRRAVATLEHALADPLSAVRARAAAVIGGLKSSRAVEIVAGAIARERDPDVLTELHIALGQLGTPEAVQHLIVAAEPGGFLFRRKSTIMRLAAVQGLVRASTPEALQALSELAEDKDPEVRKSLEKARRSTGEFEATPAPRTDARP